MKLFVLITLVVAITFNIVSAIVSYRSISTAKDDTFQLADGISAVNKGHVAWTKLKQAPHRQPMVTVPANTLAGTEVIGISPNISCE